ncbi:type I toxin-antitoxin system ptaRNA1 family toxin [Vibrio diabolicus]|uniref:type I toxin-antitoxin system ptaRNA1 family toxin n=1 Tax=Vibrio diabolicus TaxID=50719 RepID=UPI0037503C59
MTTTHNIEVQQAATKLAALEFIDQETARQISPVADKNVNKFTSTTNLRLGWRLLRV